MYKKHKPRRSESNLKDIYVLLNEAKRDLKVAEAKSPHTSFFSSALESAIRKITIAENRLSAESFIDGVYIEKIIRDLKEQDEQLTYFNLDIHKNFDVGKPSNNPYYYQIRGIA